MKKITHLLLIIIALTAQSLPAQGLFSLFTGSDSKKSIRVKYVDGDEKAKDEVLLISIKGIIQERDSDDGIPFKIEKDLFETLKKDLEVARKRKAVKAILLEINSQAAK